MKAMAFFWKRSAVNLMTRTAKTAMRVREIRTSGSEMVPKAFLMKMASGADGGK